MPDHDRPLPDRHAGSPAPLNDLLIDAEADDEPVSRPSLLRHPAFLLFGLVLVALNLRPALSSISPLLGEVSASLHLSAAAAGLLTTLPVLCLGLFAPFAPRLARRFGAERVILGILLLLALGIVLRSLFAVPGLFAGSLLAGASIGIIGVLLPGIVKRDFPKQAGSMTGVYTMALCLGAATAAGSTVPLRDAFGSWSLALGFWALPPLVAALVWLPQARRGHAVAHVAYRVSGLWRDPLAWQVTLYMGLQSSLAYIVFGWLPSILIDRGLTPVQAGLMLSASVLVQLITALSTPWLATRGRDQRPAVVVVMGLTLCGLLCCLYAPLSGLWLWVAILGLGQGGTFSLGLALIVLRSRDAHVAASLSGMAQGVGYTLAALGPLAMGLVHDFTGNWSASGVIFVTIALVGTLFGLGAGRALYVRASAERL